MNERPKEFKFNKVHLHTEILLVECQAKNRKSEYILHEVNIFEPICSSLTFGFASLNESDLYHKKILFSLSFQFWVVLFIFHLKICIVKIHHIYSWNGFKRMEYPAFTLALTQNESLCHRERVDEERKVIWRSNRMIIATLILPHPEAFVSTTYP